MLVVRLVVSDAVRFVVRDLSSLISISAYCVDCMVSLGICWGSDVTKSLSLSMIFVFFRGGFTSCRFSSPFSVFLVCTTLLLSQSLNFP